MAPESLLAAVDLGSNSFRLEIGRVGSHQRIERVEYLKETVRQGNGLNERHELTDEAMQRGWDCLARFGERLAGFAADQVRAVATQTLREARNRDVFIARGSTLLGFPIEVISGEEEARLIYRGVSSLLPPSSQRRLVVDIGGRSTEVIIGQHGEARQVASYPIGSVAWSTQFFGEGTLSRALLGRHQGGAGGTHPDRIGLSSHRMGLRLCIVRHGQRRGRHPGGQRLLRAADHARQPALAA